jgi:hypothetical protein
MDLSGVLSTREETTSSLFSKRLLIQSPRSPIDALLFDEALAFVNALLFDAALVINLAEALDVVDTVHFNEALVVAKSFLFVKRYPFLLC